MTGKTGRINYLLAAAALIIWSSCNSDLIYTDAVTITGASWNLFDNAEFQFPVNDTTRSTNMFFTLRTGSRYPYRNIFLFVTTIAPDGKSITDTLEYQLADARGRWLGKGFGDIHEMKLPYKINVFFPQRGTYRFNIRHGMRNNDLQGVYDIGLRIEKH